MENLKQSIFKSTYLTFVIIGNIIALAVVVLLLLYKFDTLNPATIMGSLFVLLSVNITAVPMFSYGAIGGNMFVVKNAIIPSRSKEYYYNDIKMVILNYKGAITVEFMLKESGGSGSKSHTLFLTPKEDLKRIIELFESKDIKCVYDNVDKSLL